MIDINNLPQGTTNLIKVYYRAIGLKKKQRTVKSHVLLIGYYPQQSNIDDIKQQALIFQSENFKTIKKSDYLIQNTQIEVNGHMLIEKFGSDEIFSQKSYEIQ